MSFDLSKVLSQAKEVAENSGSSNSTKLVYPQNGTLKVRLLFNPKSGVVIRKTERHTINGVKNPCLGQYGLECQTCKTLSDINNAKGLDLWKFKRTTRGIAYAEYVSSDYKWDNPKYEPKSGEVVLLMFPFTVYQDLNRIMSSSGDKIYSLVASNVGPTIDIQRYTENNQVKYRSSIDAFDMNHQTRSTEEEYTKLLEDLDNLNEKIVPLQVTDEIKKADAEMAALLTKEYLNPQDAYSQPNVGTAGNTLGGLGGMPQSNVPPVPPTPQTYKDPNTGVEYELVNNQWVMKTPPTPVPPVPPTPAFSQPSSTPEPRRDASQVIPDKPQCFGQYGREGINPNSCLLCPNEAECSANTKAF